jgi:tetratricopeptide (TPR) repeat protein
MCTARRTFIFLTGLTLAAGCGGSSLRMGHDALGHGEYAQAIAHYEAAMKTESPDEQPSTRLASAHRALAAILLDEGRCAPARDHLKAADDLTRPVLVDHQRLFDCTTSLGGDRDTRISDLQRLVDLGDHRAVVFRALMLLLFEAGSDAEAVVLAPNLSKRYVLTKDDHQRIAAAYFRLDQKEAAMPHLRALAKSDPHDPLNRLKMAVVHEFSGALLEARRLYVALTVDFPRNPVVFLRLAKFLRTQDDPHGARAAQAEADRLRGLDLGPRNLRPLLPSKH